MRLCPRARRLRCRALLLCVAFFAAWAVFQPARTSDDDESMAVTGFSGQRISQRSQRDRRRRDADAVRERARADAELDRCRVIGRCDCRYVCTLHGCLSSGFNSVRASHLSDACEVPRDQTLPRRCAHAATSPEACAPAVRCHVDGNSAFECDPTRIEAPLSLNAAVPNIVHWVSSGADGEFFPYWALLTASAVMDVLTPETFYFHHTAGCLPSGPHWALVVQWLTLSPTPAIEEVYGNPTRLKAHRSDVMRLQALLKHGGIYVDWDVLPLRSFASLMRNSFVIGLQSERRCANAVIVAEPHAEFVVRWLDAYHSFNERDWDGHSVRLPWQLAERFPGTAVLLPRTAWFTPGPDDDPGYQLFQRNTSAQTSPEQRPFALHLWHQISGVFLEQITGPEWLKENKHTRFARELGHMAQRGGRVAAAVG